MLTERLIVLLQKVEHLLLRVLLSHDGGCSDLDSRLQLLIQIVRSALVPRRIIESMLVAVLRLEAFDKVVHLLIRSVYFSLSYYSN